jgi:hypothetical protein
MEPFCGKKICIVSNGFLLSEALCCAGVLIGGGRNLHEEGGCVLLLWFVDLEKLTDPLHMKVRIEACSKARTVGLIDPLRLHVL